ncbi:hypothetical protein KW783_01500, partial [Candidatus Parcubacteria bacterium]|nr:hypothetical protein [Candidatus Parcubacteria bacterium]
MLENKGEVLGLLKSYQRILKRLGPDSDIAIGFRNDHENLGDELKKADLFWRMENPPRLSHEDMYR